MHHSRFGGLIIDCKTDDLKREAKFWSNALGYKIRPSDDPDDETYVSLDTPEGEPYIEVQSVEHTSRVHLDIKTDNLEAEVQRLERLGAIRVKLVNFCVAEVFGVFMKYSFGKWNPHVSSRGAIDTRVYKSLVKQFQDDIHNGKFLYHYELSRYHVLGINLVAPIDHYFRVSRKRLAKGKKRASEKKVNPNVTPMGTLDHLIISMGVHLAKIHGRNDTVLVSADDRLTEILRKCKSSIPEATLKKLCLNGVEKLTGTPFCPSTFPRHVNLKTATIPELKRVFGQWPLPVKRFKRPYRYTQ